ncbi:MAG: AmmeMemoRadiSam system protein B [Myxococcaceae bacterium]
MDVRPPAVAGSFYPADPARLARDLGRLLGSGAPRATAALPKALIVPHAGYVYSGPVAASAYSLLRELGRRIERVVLLGPSHHVAFRGLALPGARALSTPLGELEVDGEGSSRAANLRQVATSPEAHALEHSLEVQLPFLQTLLPGASLVPLVVGRADAGAVAEVLDLLWGGDETLIVASTDLSHFLSYEEAKRLDRATADRILSLDEAPLGPEQACGSCVLNGLVQAARSRGLRVRELDLRSSGDTSKERGRVVGYGAFSLAAERS